MGSANNGKGLRFCLFWGPELDGTLLLFLVPFFWLGDVVRSLTQNGGRNWGEFCLHANKSLLCWNYPESRFHCLQLIEEAWRIDQSERTKNKKRRIQGCQHFSPTTISALKPKKRYSRVGTSTSKLTCAYSLSIAAFFWLNVLKTQIKIRYQTYNNNFM